MTKIKNVNTKPSPVEKMCALFEVRWLLEFSHILDVRLLAVRLDSVLKQVMKYELSSVLLLPASSLPLTSNLNVQRKLNSFPT